MFPSRSESYPPSQANYSLNLDYPEKHHFVNLIFYYIKKTGLTSMIVSTIFPMNAVKGIS